MKRTMSLTAAGRVMALAFVVLSAGFSSGCVTTPRLLPGDIKNAFDNRGVRLEVYRDRSGDKLRFLDNAGCRKGNKGCVKIGKNRFGSIAFSLRFAKEASFDWKLNRMELRDGEGRWPGDAGYSLDPDIVADFNMGACPVAGVVCEAHIPKSGRRMMVEDNNDHAFEVHYRILVRNSDGEELVAHPIIVNRGTHTY